MGKHARRQLPPQRGVPLGVGPGHAGGAAAHRGRGGAARVVRGRQPAGGREAGPAVTSGGQSSASGMGRAAPEGPTPDPRAGQQSCVELGRKSNRKTTFLTF